MFNAERSPEEHRGGGFLHRHPVEGAATAVGLRERRQGGRHHDRVGVLGQLGGQRRVERLVGEEAMLQPDDAIGLYRTVSLGWEVPVGRCVEAPVDRDSQRRMADLDTGDAVGGRRGDHRLGGLQRCPAGCAAVPVAGTTGAGDGVATPKADSTLARTLAGVIAVRRAPACWEAAAFGAAAAVGFGVCTRETTAAGATRCRLAAAARAELFDDCEVDVPECSALPPVSAAAVPLPVSRAAPMPAKTATVPHQIRRSRSTPASSSAIAQTLSECGAAANPFFLE